MNSIGAHGFHYADGAIFQINGGARIVPTNIRAQREWITGADGRPILADSLNINDLDKALVPLRKVFPNASMNLMTGELVLKSSISIIGGLPFGVASWYVVLSGRSNPDAKVAIHPLGAALLGWLDSKKQTSPGDGSGLDSLQTQVQALGNGILAELV